MPPGGMPEGMGPGQVDRFRGDPMAPDRVERAPGEEGLAAEFGESLLSQARVALSRGRQKEAIQYLLASAATGEDEEVLQQYRWSDGLKRPLLTIRWGLAIQPNLPRALVDVLEAMMPSGGGVQQAESVPFGVRPGGPEMGGPGAGQRGFGEPGMGRAPGGNRRFDEPGMAAPGVPGGNRRFAEPGMAAPGVRGGNRAFGEPGMAAPGVPGGNRAFGEPGMAAPGVPGGNRAFGEPGMGAPGTGGRRFGESVADAARAVNIAGAKDNPLGYWTEMLGQPMIDRLEKRARQGHFGEFFRQSSGGVPGAGPGGESNVAMLGVITKPKELRPSALKEGVDVLLVAQISGKASRSGKMPQTSMVLRITDVDRDKQLWESKPLASSRVAGALRTNKKRGDPLSELNDELMKEVEKLHLAEMPNISSEAAGGRAKKLVAKKRENPLPVLAELRYYESKKLLTSEQLAELYTKLIGKEDGPRLATGTEQQRNEIVRQWLSK